MNKIIIITGRIITSGIITSEIIKIHISAQEGSCEIGESPRGGLHVHVSNVQYREADISVSARESPKSQIF